MLGNMLCCLVDLSQDKDFSDQSVNVTEQDDGQTWDDIKVSAICACGVTVNMETH